MWRWGCRSRRGRIWGGGRGMVGSFEGGDVCRGWVGSFGRSREGEEE